MLPTPKQRARAAGMAGSSSTWNAGDPSRNFLGPRATHALMTELAALGRQAPCTPQELDRRHHGHRVPRNPDSKTAFGRPAIESSRAPIGFETWEGSRGRATGYRPSPRTRYTAAQDTVTLYNDPIDHPYRLTVAYSGQLAATAARLVASLLGEHPPSSPQARATRSRVGDRR